MIQVVFTTRDTFVSRAIRYLTEGPVSHVALRFKDTVVHSTGKGGGVETISWEDFLSKYTVVHQARVKGSKDQLLKVQDKYEDARYDYVGLAWLAVRYILKRWCKLDIPKVNLWNITGMFTCTEFVTEVIDGEADSLITPYQLYRRLSGHG